MPKKKARPIRINRTRMAKEFEALSRIGRFGRAGIDRVALTPEYNRARDLVRRWMEAAGLGIRVDPVGNLIGRKEGVAKNLPAVMTGSHLDSQRPGGRFDGTAGVLCALEAVRRIGEEGFPHDHPIEVAAFVGEESACGLSQFGSGVMAGQVGAAKMRATIHPPTGKSLYHAVRAAGGNPDKPKECILPKKSLKAFLELHVEQGPVLEAKKIPIGIVDAIVGVRRGEIIFEGVTAHAGGQPMVYRRDAAVAAAEFITGLDAAARRVPGRQRLTLTFGYVSAQPGAVSIIAGRVRLLFDLRAKSESAIENILARMRKALERIHKTKRVKSRMKINTNFPPFPCASGIRRALRRAAAEGGYRSLSLSSGGIHDACRMASLCPMGMVFVPSAKGLSHTPAEFTSAPHLAAGAEVLLSALVRLADKRAKS